MTRSPPTRSSPSSTFRNDREDPMPDDREPNRDDFECYDVDSRCENCGKWECGAGESSEPHPWKVCPECYRCGECGHDPDCDAYPKYDRDTHIADVLPLYRDRARAWLAAEHTDMEESLTLLLATIAVESMP